MYKASQEAANRHAADVAAAAERGKLLDSARTADTALREAEARSIPLRTRTERSISSRSTSRSTSSRRLMYKQPFPLVCGPSRASTDRCRLSNSPTR